MHITYKHIVHIIYVYVPKLTNKYLFIIQMYISPFTGWLGTSCSEVLNPDMKAGKPGVGRGAFCLAPIAA